MSKFLTAKQLRELLKVDRVTIYRMVNDGRLKGIKFGNQWRFPQDEIDRLLGKESVKEESEIEEHLTDFPVGCAQKLQEIFAGILGSGALIVSLKGEPLTEIQYANPFCKLVMSNQYGQEACKASWRKIALRGSGEPPYMICHAGLSYMRSMIQMDDRPLALFVTGQFYALPPDPEKEIKRLEVLALRYQIPLDQLKESAAEIPVLKRSQQEQIQKWSPKFAKVVECMLYERSNFMNRLQRIAALSDIRDTLPRSENS